MSFNIALSGLNSAQKDLDVTANNIANVATTGFKESRAEFADVYASSLFTNTRTKAGDGATTNLVAQQFNQGSMLFTNNALDLAITGQGFFASTPDLSSKDITYTRAGAFKLNSDNYIVDAAGNYLQGYPVNDDGSSSSISLSTTSGIQIPETAGVPVKTAEVEVGLNLDASDNEFALNLFDPTDPLTYNNSTSLTIYDSLGESHLLKLYFVKPIGASYDDQVTGAGQVSQWTVFMEVDGKPVNMWEDPAADPTGGDPTSALSMIGFDSNADGIFNAADYDGTNADPTLTGGAAPGAGGINGPDNTVLVDHDADGAIGTPRINVQGGFRYVATPLVSNPDVPYWTGGVLRFDNTGTFIDTIPDKLLSQALGKDDILDTGGTTDGADVLLPGADGDQKFELKFRNPTQFSSSFEVTSLEQDGLTVGRLTGVEVGVDGLVNATYSNGTSQPLARVAVARFANEQGLTQVGGTSWKGSTASGEPIPGEAASGTFGNINSGALEQSNVSLTQELVDLITSQRNFQANSRALEVNSQLQQTIIQIR